MKEQIQNQVAQALAAMVAAGEADEQSIPKLDEITVERSRGGEHGDFACPIAMSLARTLKRNPREIANQIAAHLPANDALERVEIAGPGFLNFFVSSAATSQVVQQVLDQGERYGCVDVGAGQQVQVEFVSANPTGPLHVGHGRGAAYGAALANVMSAAGFDVQREYYINDAGRQMDILAASTWLRYLQKHSGQDCAFPANGYQGDYVRDMAAALHAELGDEFVRDIAEVLADLPADVAKSGNDDSAADKAAREVHIDALIERAKILLSESGYQQVFNFVLDAQVKDIRNDLADFGVSFDRWFSEASLQANGAVQASIDRLREANFIYEKDATLWFRSTSFGDEKDRVVVRSNGVGTYFASDIAYVDNKFARGFERVIYIWGADHHGYIARLKAAAKALGHNPDNAEILLVQFASLYSAGQKMQMSTRSGQFVTLRQLYEEVGRDAARFFYVMRRSEQHLDFDLDLAKSQQKENPVYYVQYAHARIASNLRRANEQSMSLDVDQGLANLALLTLSVEQSLMGTLARLPEVVRISALAREPHQIAFYVRDLATEFHAYYATEGMKLLDENSDLRNARLTLCSAVAQVIRNALSLLDVSAPESM